MDWLFEYVSEGAAGELEPESIDAAPLRSAAWLYPTADDPKFWDELAAVRIADRSRDGQGWAERDEVFLAIGAHFEIVEAHMIFGGNIQGELLVGRIIPDEPTCLVGIRIDLGLGRGRFGRRRLAALERVEVNAGSGHGLAGSIDHAQDQRLAPLQGDSHRSRFRQHIRFDCPSGESRRFGSDQIL